MPERIQLRRTRGWRLPPGAVSVARPGKHGNPFALKRPFSRDDPLRAFLDRAVLEVCCFDPSDTLSHYDVIRPHTPLVAVTAFRFYLDANPRLAESARAALRGRSLACWCPVPRPGDPDICHAVVWLEVCNA